MGYRKVSYAEQLYYIVKGWIRLKFERNKDKRNEKERQRHD